MQFLYWLEGIRMPLLTDLMLAVTHLGEETPFLVAALIVFWCVDKYHGYYMLAVGLLGNMANQFLKITCRVSRPWVRDGAFTAVEAAKAEAGGYSFPSGHSQTSVGTFGCIAVTQKNRFLRGICIAVMILVPFSRMYLGVHTPADVLVGSAMALMLVFAMKPLTQGNNKRNIPWIFSVLLALSIIYLFYVERYHFPADIQEENLASAIKNGYTFLGCFVGILIVWVADEKKFHFPTDAVWWAQILKVVLGLALVLAVKEGTRSVLELVLPVYPARAVRYCLIVVAAGVVWPLTFQWFSKLGRKYA